MIENKKHFIILVKMEGFPKEINVEVLKNLPGKEIMNLCSTSKNFNTICSDDPKYASLWKLKIVEDFQEIYSGNLAFTQYKYLSKLYNGYFYLLYHTADVVEKELVGVFDTYKKAVAAGIEFIQEDLDEDGRQSSLESIIYLFRNEGRASYRDHDYQIERIILSKPDILDDRKFFQDRENLYQKLFGKSSEGASSQIRNPFEEKIANRKKGAKRASKRAMKNIIPFPIQFFQTLDEVMIQVSYSHNVDNEILVFDFMDLNDDQLEILREYISENLFNPTEMNDEGEEIDDEDEDEDEEDEEDELPVVIE